MNTAAVPVVTIDGPAGAGKSTIAALVATKFNYHLLVSGSLYRVLALFTLEKDLDAEDTQALVALIPEMQVEFIPIEGTVCVRLHGRDVTQILSGEDCALVASRIAQLPEVRANLLKYQHAFRRPPGLVAEGRDMGTVVFSGAKLKVFLTADLEERARRRFKQLSDRGFNGNLATLYEQLAARDERDKHRSIAPLKPALDATVIDTTGKSINTILEEIETLVNYHYA